MYRLYWGDKSAVIQGECPRVELGANVLIHDDIGRPVRARVTGTWMIGETQCIQVAKHVSPAWNWIAWAIVVTLVAGTALTALIQ